MHVQFCLINGHMSHGILNSVICVTGESLDQPAHPLKRKDKKKPKNKRSYKILSLLVTLNGIFQMKNSVIFLIIAKSIAYG